MDIKKFLRPTIGKALMTVFFIMLPVPIHSYLIETLKAKWVPIIFIPFISKNTSYAYLASFLILLLFFILSSLISNLYHRFVLKYPEEKLDM
ncbi:hypothetical protein HY989_01790 [Candidatus Micrarchaeota archaeon]|nr:hypothetical protein [Candidatus Micrarchaeota archaeon]